MKSGSQRTLSRLGVLLLLSGAALLVSGCIRVYGSNDEPQFMVIDGNASDQIIWSCTTPGQNRGACALEKVQALCNGFRVTTAGRCQSITWVDHRDDVQVAMDQVAGPNADCLAAYLAWPDPVLWGWISLPLHAYGCERSFPPGRG